MRRLWMRVPDLARRLLLATLLGFVVLSPWGGLTVDPSLFAGVLLVPAAWVLVIVASWMHVRSRSRIEAWERAKVRRKSERGLRRSTSYAIAAL